jgi:hypothetical protein
MTAPFATRADLETTLKKTFAAVDEQAQVDDLLAQASDHLRSEVLGWQVYPPATASFTTMLHDGRHMLLPSQPATLTGVVWKDNGTAVTYDEYDGGFTPTGSGIATVTFTAGYTTAPGVLKSWTVALAAQALAHLKQLGVPVADAYSSVGIDDFKVVWNQQGQSGWGIPATAVEALRNQFATSAYVTGR